ncbi:putative mitochondrial enoyl-CoA hydratase/isomerase family protein, conserved [Leptomonas pyrrhocoris]|uniref:Putative mitochondrial enoyl-CoA hydratase/isomerase family protein, conserved n=1 Tax=Leptomonas pyrrhocoris TaxID=157538 RepID=A0A0M9GA12_LEPPY|nr:putative mitochondrial enoyl-CoA hydratase/isomerase family protein, conserved [Leptomonas pyrrhocoris]XP_015664333.1 putative mitochondrial enoyl-CoA hydratase/isomerase family protein, conserved [Leptomonas pyrrhocoris]KPA85893.1 putative mitochondrial enoyl-CoA hydratase/isomerase family protein, conserved [Leptomonas pyrrhocoris]KPA85894.1 putative mitochondrial enoyl-CoA hydratase/isomerase family protein, conserved [Leptomonas pyrrhocoris]|eukprot:XP_015664332.1 putative mitochondrial enoyl-CoA hydratase/isomerase family protein, conserved [Leptomonas pyrrhocoris]
MRSCVFLRSAAGAAAGASLAALKVLLQDECVLRYDTASQVAVLSMERHSRKNAIGVNFLSCIQKVIDVCNAGAPCAAAGRPADAVPVRCLIVTSAVPKVFCAGADLKERKDMSVTQSREFVQRVRHTFNNLEDLPIPTIAAIEGKALGGGMELALALDMRVAGDGAAVGFPETGLAIIPGAGGTVRAPAVLGVSRALELILTAEQVSAQRALELGLVNRVVPAGSALDAAFDLALRIAKNGPLGVCAAKKAVRASLGKTRAEAMKVEAEQYDVVLATEDRLEGLKAFAEHRPPAYEGK